MEYRQLGASGLTISRFCLGTLTFGQTQWGCDEATARDIIGTFRDHGGNFVDTADAYNGGLAEEILGRSRSPASRDELVIGTKLGLPTGSGANSMGASRKHLLSGIDASLRRLGTDYVDIVQVHAYDPSTPIEETISTLDDIVRSGRARYVGASNFFAWQLADASRCAERRDAPPFTSVQMMYSLVRRDVEREHIALCAARGIGLLAYSPLHGGVLASPLSATDGRATSARVGTHPHLQDVYLPDADRIARIVATVADVAAAAGVSLSTTALSWLLAQKPITALIVGADTKAATVGQPRRRRCRPRRRRDRGPRCRIGTSAQLPDGLLRSVFGHRQIREGRTRVIRPPITAP